jgi:hypothetical protein
MTTYLIDINKLIGESYFILKKLVGTEVTIPGEFADNIPVRDLPYQEKKEGDEQGEIQYTAPVGNIILEDEKSLQTIAEYESNELQTMYNKNSLVKPS